MNYCATKSCFCAVTGWGKGIFSSHPKGLHHFAWWGKELHSPHSGRCFVRIQQIVYQDIRLYTAFPDTSEGKASAVNMNKMKNFVTERMWIHWGFIRGKSCMCMCVCMFHWSRPEFSIIDCRRVPHYFCLSPASMARIRDWANSNRSYSGELCVGLLHADGNPIIV